MNWKNGLVISNKKGSVIHNENDSLSSSDEDDIDMMNTDENVVVIETHDTPDVTPKNSNK